MTSNIVAWLLGLLPLRVHAGYRKEVALKTLGSFGILDLPMYVLLPQMGLQHWIVLGGNIPEPLIGARSMGIPDSAFYAAVTFTTLGLLLLYSRRLRSEAAKAVATVTDRLSTSRGKPGPTEDLLHTCCATAKAYRLDLTAENLPGMHIERR